ncbi:1,4-alpha-glucan branching protein GlgB [Klugiella xanthotipulae]|uniref:1,4-alpha-glucan branching enzyme GlgB n=1 Tax=Klugiella xanthotipulae TaxID=244735 RepID=A0A543HRY0_9MICO|nr:1,4-alpha-glucan branching protein GlgB [Klugiella xanthotipulae]TQM61097.1 1,4-alpha-glucan branching enzyme [Klugiella xanthotipulae]
MASGGARTSNTASEPTPDVLLSLAHGTHSDPHSVLGQHRQTVAGGTSVTVIRALRPLAARVVARRDDGTRVPLAHLGQGVWQGSTLEEPDDYVLHTDYAEGHTWVADDPYRYPPTLGELDLHLLAEGRHEQLWTVLGSHTRDHHGVHKLTPGVSFSVWAPRARAVRVVGNFNTWDGALHNLRRLGGSGVWEVFLPHLTPGEVYKFQILGRDNIWRTKADPVARRTEHPPATASIIEKSHYEWQDEEWLATRAASSLHTAPLSVYELHLGSWRPGLGYREAADQLIEYVQQLGFTHVEFMPLAEHPYTPSWGYQVTGYYAPTSRFGTPDDLRYLIDRLHGAGIGVLLDWVPGHFPKDEWALARFDGEPLYEHPDPRRGEQQDWGTLVFDFGNPGVRNFLVANALYWCEEFHIDGLRVDAVASMLYLDYSRGEGEWLPNIHGGRENLEAVSLLQEVTATVYRRHPGVIMIAEESTSWDGVTRRTDSGGLGFGLKWNMGWMNDTLRYLANDPMYRSHHHNDITFSLAYAWSENYILPISHDEVVHGKGSLVAKMPGTPEQKLANVRAYLAFMWAHPGKKLLFMGQEFGQLDEWSEQRGLDWWISDEPGHRGLLALTADLNAQYRSTPALWQLDESPTGFEWIAAHDGSHNVVSFIRWDEQRRPTVVIVNFSGIDLNGYRLGLPREGRWGTVFSSNHARYGGWDAPGQATWQGEARPWDGQPASTALLVPALSALYLQPTT